MEQHSLQRSRVYPLTILNDFDGVFLIVSIFFFVVIVPPVLLIISSGTPWFYGLVLLVYGPFAYWNIRESEKRQRLQARGEGRIQTVAEQEQNFREYLAILSRVKKKPLWKRLLHVT